MRDSGKEEVTSEGRERGWRSQREEGPTENGYVIERGGEMSVDTSGLLRFLGSEERHRDLDWVCSFLSVTLRRDILSFDKD